MNNLKEAKQDIIFFRERLVEEMNSFFFKVSTREAELRLLLDRDVWKKKNLDSVDLESSVEDLANVLQEIREMAEDMEVHAADMEAYVQDLSDAEHEVDEEEG